MLRAGLFGLLVIGGGLRSASGESFLFLIICAEALLEREKGGQRGFAYTASLLPSLPCLPGTLRALCPPVAISFDVPLFFFALEGRESERV